MLKFLSVTGVFVLLTAMLQRPTSVEVSQPPAEDWALMEELRRRVESLPEERQESEGVQILVENVGRFQSEPMRKHVCLSIAKLYQRLGQPDSAEVYFRKAGVPQGEDGHPSEVNARSPEHLLEVLERTDDLNAAVEQVLQLPADLRVSNLEFAALTYKAGRALIKSGDAAGGVELGIAAASERPCRESFAKLETLAADADIHTPGGKSFAGMKAMRWLHMNSGSFGQSARFLSNLSFSEEVYGDIPAATAALQELIERHPESSDAAYALMRLSQFCSDAGDDVAERDYLTQVIDGNGPSEVRERASKVLQMIAAEAPPVSVTPATGGRHFAVLVVMHAVLFGSVAAVWWWKRRRQDRT